MNENHTQLMSDASSCAVELVIAADCVFLFNPSLLERHKKEGRQTLLCCPEKEEAHALAQRITLALREQNPTLLHVIRMRMPCCCIDTLLAQLQKIEGKEVPILTFFPGRNGEERQRTFPPPPACHSI